MIPDVAREKRDNLAGDPVMRRWNAAKKKSRLDPAKEVKRLARERIGTVPPARVEEEKRDKRQEKHKKTWEDWEKE